MNEGSATTRRSGVKGEPDVPGAPSPGERRVDSNQSTEPQFHRERAVKDSGLHQRWRRVRQRAEVVVPGVRRLVVVAPHPDDETLTVGGMIQRVLASGGSVEVVAVTDGGSAYPGRWPHDELADVRRREQTAALARLGVGSESITRCGLRDGDVARDVDVLTERLHGIVGASTTLLAPWSHDVHPDHEAVGRSAALVADRKGCESWSSLFWAWHHADSRIETTDLIRLELTEGEAARKHHALMCHRSQLDSSNGEPVLDSRNLAPARWADELFVVTRRASATRS